MSSAHCSLTFCFFLHWTGSLLDYWFSGGSRLRGWASESLRSCCTRTGDAAQFAGLATHANMCRCATVYIFVGTILLDHGALSITAGAIVGIIGIGYAVLEFVPQIEPPQNMRDAGGEWGAEQV